MRSEATYSSQTITLEAPGEFLSGLLGVSAVLQLYLEGESARELPEEYGAWHILSPFSGTLRVAAGDCSWPLEPGQSAAFDGGSELALLPLSVCELCVLTLRGSVPDQIFSECRKEGGLFFPRGGEALSRMLHMLSGRSRSIPASEASELAYTLLMSCVGAGTSGPEGQRMLPPVVEAALGIIRRDYAFLDGIAELAERLEISQEYLTRCFLKYTGITPGKYLNRVRIENAKLLLRQGQHSIQFVSDACGFANANYFARVFRRSVGVNPREYARTQELMLSSPQEDRLYVL